MIQTLLTKARTWGLTNSLIALLHSLVCVIVIV